MNNPFLSKNKRRLLINTRRLLLKNIPTLGLKHSHLGNNRRAVSSSTVVADLIDDRWEANRQS